MKSPCLDCPDRHLGCHSTCEKYISFQKLHKEEKARMSEAKLADQEFRGTRRLSKMRAVRAKGSNDYYRYDRFRKTK